MFPCQGENYNIPSSRVGLEWITNQAERMRPVLYTLPKISGNRASGHIFFEARGNSVVESAIGTLPNNLRPTKDCAQSDMNGPTEEQLIFGQLGLADRDVRHHGSITSIDR